MLAVIALDLSTLPSEIGCKLVDHASFIAESNKSLSGWDVVKDQYNPTQGSLLTIEMVQMLVNHLRTHGRTPPT